MTVAVSENPWPQLRQRVQTASSPVAELYDDESSTPRRSRTKGMWTISFFVVGLFFGVGVAAGHIYTTLA